jgi:hypothetical protein
MHPQTQDPRGQLLENFIHDYHLVKSMAQEQNTVAVHAALIAYGISCAALHLNFTHEELDKGLIINGFRVYSDHSDAGVPLKIERMN